MTVAPGLLRAGPSARACRPGQGRAAGAANAACEVRRPEPRGRGSEQQRARGRGRGGPLLLVARQGHIDVGGQGNPVGLGRCQRAGDAVRDPSNCELVRYVAADGCRVPLLHDRHRSWVGQGRHRGELNGAARRDGLELPDRPAVGSVRSTFGGGAGRLARRGRGGQVPRLPSQHDLPHDPGGPARRPPFPGSYPAGRPRRLHRTLPHQARRAGAPERLRRRAW